MKNSYRKSLCIITMVLFAVFSIQLGAFAATQYYDKGPISYNPICYTDYGLKNFPYKLTMHESTDPSGSSRNVFYHEAYGSFYANLYGGQTTPDGISWDVNVTNSYYSGSTRKLAVNDWDWSPVSMYLNPGYSMLGGWNTTDVLVSFSSSKVESMTVVSGDKLWSNPRNYTTINF